MPTYDYQCNACDEEFEFFHSITAEPLTKCPTCEEETLRRLIGTGAGIIFKGSGFYQTDYKNTSDTNSKETSKKEDKKNDSNTTESKKTTSESSGSGDKSGQKSSAKAGVE